MTTPAAVRPGLAIAGSVVTFALLIERAGLLAAVVATVLVASLGSRRITARETVFCALGLAAATAILFVGLLDQPLPLFPDF